MRKALIVALLTAALVSATSAEDSPLVALAKRTNRKATPKAPVITNEMVSKSKGRLSMAGGDGTTATNSAPTLPPAAAPAPATTTTPPPVGVPVVRVTSAPAPAYPSSARNIDPQSTVQFRDAQASARTIDPTSGAGRIDPQSTAGTIQPATTAQNIPPQSTSAPPR
jgi:hypothetical protein